MASTKYLTISTLEGGLNDFDPALSLREDSCTTAENVEFFYSSLGERRLGCVGIGLPVSVSADANIQTVAWMGRHLPSNDQTLSELWALAQNLTTNTSVLIRRNSTVWSTVTPTIDSLTVTNGQGHLLSSVSLHGKFYIAHKSAQDRTHVWDGTDFRRASIAAPAAAPTAINTGGGAYASIRYFRVRYVVMSGSTVLRRSEPSAVLIFTPSGAGSGAIVTKPAASAEGETHWELEASTDNAVFYRIAQTVVGTTTVTDSAAFATGYSTGVLSDTVTSNTVLPSGKFLSIDQDRLLIAGSWENTAYASRLWWTPVLGSTGVGNDERLDMTVNPYIDLDGFEGGEITGISRSVNGYFYVFKFGHIYKVARTGVRTNAYNAIPITKSRGAFINSIVEAVDEAGSPALYFLDPKVGPMRIGSNGLEWCGSDIRTLWTRVNQSAKVPAHGVFYQSKNQVHFWLALDGADYPNAKIVVHCDQINSTATGAVRGWVTVPVGDRIAAAHCSVMFSNNVDSTDPRNQALVPFIGKEQWIVSGSTIKNLIQQCDTGATDCFTAGDNDAYYFGMVQTKAFLPAGLMSRCGVMSASIAADASNDANNNLYIKGIKDFGTGEVLIGVVFTPTLAGEDFVIKDLDQFSFSEVRAVQITFGDLDETILPSASWKIQHFSMKVRMEQTG